MKRFIEAMAVEELDEEEPAPGAAEGEGGGAAGGSEAVEEFTRVERVLAEAAQGEGLPPAYLVKWRGLPYSACTWECTRHLLHAQPEIGRFRACCRARRQPRTREPYATPSRGAGAGVGAGAGAGAGAAQPSRIYKGGNELRAYQVEDLHLSTPLPQPLTLTYPTPDQVEGLHLSTPLPQPLPLLNLP